MPDLIVRQPRSAPVVVETEYLPARTVEKDAIHRLGQELSDSGDAIEQCIALRAPAKLKRVHQGELQSAAAGATYQYCLFSGSDERYTRWPSKGWILGTVDDLAGLLERASISERVVARSLDILEAGIRDAASRLRCETSDRPEVNARIAATLCQEDGEQTSRMAMAIVANALTFQMMLAGMHDVRTFDALRVSGALLKAPVLREWERILQINYWPIFHVAQEVLAPIPDGISSTLLDSLADVSSQLDAHGVTQSHDIYGRTFQRLISDRKFLATFYTLPASAALLAELAVGMLDTDWSDPEAVAQLRVCDFACGTGTLITAAYQAMLARYRRTGRDDAAIHQRMMEESVFAADIMPAATHLTTSMLSSSHPMTPFERTQVHLLAYGKQEVGTARFALGALDLIHQQYGTGLFENTGIEVHHGKKGAQDIVQPGVGWSRSFALQHQSMDLVIMNPPFTRPTNHEIATVPVPSFAGMGITQMNKAQCRTFSGKYEARSTTPRGTGMPASPPTFLIWLTQKSAQAAC